MTWLPPPPPPDGSEPIVDPQSGPTLPPGFISGTQHPITKPGYLFELGFTPPLRYSTRGDQVFGGEFFASGFVGAFDIGSRRLSLINQDNAVSTIVLSQGVADRYVKVWQYYGDAATTDTTILLLDGFIDGAPAIGDRVILSLYDEAAGVMFAPRHRINRHNGYNVLPQPGLRIQWGNALFVLKPGRDG
jgi:hypothetical protein